MCIVNNIFEGVFDTPARSNQTNKSLTRLKVV